MMVRADLLKQLFRVYHTSDCECAMDEVRAIADEEHKKHHPARANELLRRGVRPTRQHRRKGGELSG
jgi:hypothetical protein